MNGNQQWLAELKTKIDTNALGRWALSIGTSTPLTYAQARRQAAAEVAKSERVRPAALRKTASTDTAGTDYRSLWIDRIMGMKRRGVADQDA